MELSCRPKLFLNPDGIAAQIQDPLDENLSPIQFVVDGKRKPPAQLAMVAKNLSMNSRVEQERVDFRIDGIEKKISDANVLDFVKTKARLQIPLSEIEDSNFSPGRHGCTNPLLGIVPIGEF